MAALDAFNVLPEGGRFFHGCVAHGMLEQLHRQKTRTIHQGSDISTVIENILQWPRLYV
jgi:hypothetical protein